jgi:hypothetical protein
VFHRDSLARQHGGTPAKTGRQGNLGIALDAQRVANHLVERAVEIAAPEQHVLGYRQLLLQLGQMRLAHLFDISGHLGVRRQQIGKNRQ